MHIIQKPNHSDLVVQGQNPASPRQLAQLPLGIQKQEGPNRRTSEVREKREADNISPFADQHSMEGVPEAVSSLSPDYNSTVRKDSKVASNSGIHNQVVSHEAPVRDSSIDKRYNGDHLSSDDNNPLEVAGGSGVLSTSNNNNYIRKGEKSNSKTNSMFKNLANPANYSSVSKRNSVEKMNASGTGNTRTAKSPVPTKKGTTASGSNNDKAAHQQKQSVKQLGLSYGIITK